MPYFDVGLVNKLGHKTKRTTDTDLTCHRYFTIHHLDQTLGNSQPKSGTTIFPGYGRIGLGKGCKQFADLQFGHPDPGIFNHKLNSATCVVLINQLGFNKDMTFLSKLNSIIGQVDKHLSQPQRVSDQGKGYIFRNAL